MSEKIKVEFVEIDPKAKLEAAHYKNTRGIKSAKRIKVEEKNPDEKELLPTSKELLDVFMDDVIRIYDLPDDEDTRDVICTMILHMNQNAAFAPKSYFGHAVLKSLANKAAWEKLEIYKHNRDAKARAKAEEEAAKEKEVSNECGSSSCSQSS